ncbi:MAG: hypothetical protein F6K55_23400 [Moorea sp. SIO4A3]|nr:hypothetical protein [Moorena sp. SIO4A3]
MNLFFGEVYHILSHPLRHLPIAHATLISNVFTTHTLCDDPVNLNR